jgi:rhodanese-related sulfurtransferase
MEKILKKVMGSFFVIGMLLGTVGGTLAGSTGVITKEELNGLLDDPNVIILDVRTGRDWKSSEFKIKGALRANPSKFDSWIAQHEKEKRYVIYCA